MSSAAETGGSRVTQVALGYHYAAAITEDGSLYTWGRNNNGQLGDGTTEDRSTPQKIMDNVTYVALEKNGSTSAAITEDGSLWMWGSNYTGSIGDGTTTDRPSPVKVLDNVVSVSVGAGHSAAIRSDGSLWMWGWDLYGAIGSNIGDTRVPVRVMGSVTKVALGDYFTAAITEDGSLWMWGRNDSGQLGNGTTTNSSVPVPVMDSVVDVSAGVASFAAITEDGSLWTWGRNLEGHLGDGTTQNRSTPEKIMEGVTSVSMGYDHGSAIKDDGSLWTWGDNYAGELGNGTTDGSSVPVRVMEDASSVACGRDFTAAITTDGTLWGWGSSDYVGLVDGSQTWYNVPTRVVGFGDLEPDPEPEPEPDPGAGSVTVESDPADTEEPELTLSGDINIPIPESFPGIGGGEVSVDLGLVPVQFWRQGNEYRIGIGVDDLDELINGGGWTNFKKFVSTQQKNIVRGFSGLDLAATYDSLVVSGTVSPEMSVWGYAEGTIDQGGIQTVSGVISIGMHAKGTSEWQAIVVVVPVVFTFSADVGLDVEGEVGVDLDAGEVYLDSTVDLTLPKIKLTGGLGVAYVADVSVYGSATNTISIAGGLDGDLSATLSGELGARARVLCFEYEKAFWDDEWEYYNSARRIRSFAVAPLTANASDGWFGIERDAAGPWLSDALAVRARSLSTGASGQGDLSLLQENVYDGAEPQLVETSSGARAIIYTLDQEGLPDGHSTSPYISIYDEDSGTWREPVSLLGADVVGYDASYCVIDDRVWVAQVEPGEPLTNEQRQLPAEEQLWLIASGSSVILRSAHIEEDGTVTPSDHKVILSEPGECGLMPVVNQLDNGRLGVAWVENSECDPLGMSGDNRVEYCAYLPAGEIPMVAGISMYEIDELPVTDVSCGTIGGERYFVRVVDTDGDLGTLDDRIMRLTDREDDETSLPAAASLNPQFARIGEEDCLVWYDVADGSVRYLDDVASGIPATLVEGEGLSPSFSIAQGDGVQLLLTVEDKGDGEAGSDLVARRVAVGASGTLSVSEPVTLTDADGYVSDVTGVADGNSWDIALLRSDVTIEAGDLLASGEQGRVMQEADLCVLDVDEAAELEISDATLDLYGGENGDAPTLVFELRNNGLVGTEAGSASVAVDGGVIETVSVGALDAGEVRAIGLPLGSIAGSVGLGDAADVSVEMGGTETVSQSVEVGVTDLVLEADGGAEGVMYEVTNVGTASAEVVLEVRDGALGGTLLESIELGDVPAGESSAGSLDRSFVQTWGADNVCLVAAPSSAADACADDNQAFLYVSEDGVLGASLDHVRVTLPTSRFETGLPLDLADMEVTAVLTDGTEVDTQSYETNAEDIDTSRAGAAELTVTCRYAERTASVVVSIELVDPDPGVDPMPDPDPDPNPDPTPTPDPEPEPTPDPEPEPTPDPEPDPTPEPDPEPGTNPSTPRTVQMHRLYNQWTGEHFYTASAGERDSLVSVGWTSEGVGWVAPESSSTPVYRLYNPYVKGGDHHYTTSASERDALVRAGWSYEGVGWYSDDARGVPLYRQYNPYATTGTHNYTASKNENDTLVKLGWRAEGIGWYGVRG